MSIDDSKDYDLLDRLADEFADRLPPRRAAHGPKEYAERYPELADEIRELFPALVTVEQVEEICPGLREAEAPDPAAVAGRRLPDHPRDRPRGHGGGLRGRAGLARPPRGPEGAALAGWSGPHALERFRREARASARLHHTNIVPVFEIGQEGDVQLLRDAVHPGPEPGRGHRRATAAAGPIPARAQPAADPGRPRRRPGRTTRARAGSPESWGWPDPC